MNIYYITSTRVPGKSANALQVMRTAEAFSEIGHEVTVVTPKSEDRSGDGLKSDVAVKKLLCLRTLRGHDYYFRALWAVFKGAARLVYSQHIAAAFWTSVFGFPTICELNEPPQTKKGVFYLRLIARTRGFLGLSVVTESSRKYLLDKFDGLVAADQIVVARNGVDLKRFGTLPDAVEARDRLNLKQSFSAGYAGQLYEGKGGELLLILAEQHPDVQFLIMGGRSEEIKAYRTEALRRGCDNLHFLGFISNDELPMYLAACDVLLLPCLESIKSSGGDRNIAPWTSPMKMFEYMATGRPIVSSSIPAILEVLNEQNAFLCQCDNLESWACAINKLQVDNTEAELISKQARKDVAELTWHKRAQRILDGLLLEGDV